jgi:hypothetical protein
MTEEEAAKKGVSFDVYSHSFSPLRACCPREQSLSYLLYTTSVVHAIMYGCRA